MSEKKHEVLKLICAECGSNLIVKDQTNGILTCPKGHHTGNEEELLSSTPHQFARAYLVSVK